MIERWTEFQGRPNGTDRGRPRVTLSNRNVLVLNAAAYEAFGMPAAVKLSYEEDRRVIGLKPEDASRTNAFPVKLGTGKCHNRKIYLHPFCVHFGIDIRRTVLFSEIDIDNDGKLRLELNRTVTIGKSERIKK